MKFQIKSQRVIIWRIITIFIYFVVVLFVMEWWSRDNEYALQQVFPRSRVLRWATYYAVLLSVYFFAAANQEFIYVRF